MPTISTYLKMMDKFSQPLRIVSKQVDATSIAMERMHKLVEAPSKLNIDASKIQKQVAGIQKITQFAKINIAFNAREAIRKAQLLRTQIEKQLTGIQAKVQLELPASLNVMFANLQRLVMRFIAATRRLQGVAGNQATAQQQIASMQQRILHLQNQINTKTKQTGQSANDWFGQIKGIAATYLSLQGMKTLFGTTIGSAMQQRKMLDMFIARTGDIEIGTGMFEKFKIDALAAGQDVNKSLQSILSFFSTTQNVDQLSKLNNLALRMASFDSAGNGIEGAAFALKEAMSGDIVSLAERFNMSKSDIRAFKIDEFGKAGDMEGFIKAFDLLLEKQRMGQDAFDKMMASPAKQVEVLGNNLKSGLADAGGTATTALLPLITMINTAFEEGKFQPFFDGLSAGLRIIADIGVWAGNLIMNNLDIVRNILIAIGIVALAVGVKFLIAWIMAAWPILLIIAIIAGLITLLNHFGVTTSDIIGSIAGAFAVLGAFIWNTVVGVINAVIQFLWTKFVEPWIGIIEWVLNVFNGGFDSFGDAVKNLLGQIISWFLSLGKVVTKIIDAIFGTDWTSGLSDLQDKLIGWGKNDSAITLSREAPTIDSRIEYGAAWDKGFDFGNNTFSKMANGFNKVTDFADWNQQADLARSGDIDKVGEVGKIKNSVDISSEDLKIMRELAEMKNVQNFVTLQPSISFGDTHVSRESHIDTIVAKITNKLQEDIASSVDSVYV